MITKFWKCEECGSTAKHKGLCRECTTYDDEGNIVTPVSRVRYNSTGEKWQPPQKRQGVATKDMLNTMRLMRRKKPTKKQIKKELDEIKISNSGEEFIELGEGVEEE